MIFLFRTCPGFKGKLFDRVCALATAIWEQYYGRHSPTNTGALPEYKWASERDGDDEELEIDRMQRPLREDHAAADGDAIKLVKPQRFSWEESFKKLLRVAYNYHVPTFQDPLPLSEYYTIRYDDKEVDFLHPFTGKVAYHLFSIVSTNSAYQVSTIMMFSKLRNYADHNEALWQQDEYIHWADLFYLLYTDAHRQCSSFLPQSFPDPKGAVNYALFSRWEDAPTAANFMDIGDNEVESQGSNPGAQYHAVNEMMDSAARHSVDNLGCVNIVNTVDNASDQDDDEAVVVLARKRIIERESGLKAARTAKRMAASERQELDELKKKIGVKK